MGSVRGRRYVRSSPLICVADAGVALMEYHCTKAADVAGRIFERGLETFPDEVELALRYLGFLISINDDASKHLACITIVLSLNATSRCSCPVRACRQFFPYRESPTYMGPLGTIRIPVR